MNFYIALILLAGLILFSLSYRTAHIEIELYENGQSQGIIVHINLPFYRKNRSYDYSDPRLNLLEAILIDRTNSGLYDKLGFNLAALEAVLKKAPHIFHMSESEKFSAKIFKKALNFTVIERLQWNTAIGTGDAMQTALRTGYFWALKGWVAAFLSTHSQLEDIELAVKPDFVNYIFLSNFACILKMRIVHIITITIYIIVWKVRWWINGITAGPTEQPSH